MRRLFALAALAAASFASVSLSQPGPLPGSVEVEPSAPARRRAAIRLARSLGPRFPSKGKAGRPRKHRNMNHVSRRVRRKHRRSRA